MRSGSVAFARLKGVKVGEGCRIGIRDFGTEPFLISIGDRVTIAPGVQILTHDGSSWLVRDENGSRYHLIGEVKICDDVFVGANAIILPGVTISSNSVVGAGSVVTKDVPPGSVVVGNPARKICSFEEFVERTKSVGFHDNAYNMELPRKERILDVLAKRPPLQRLKGQR
ncbi:MAG TPA: acyltransferase [Alphaproteobacteria bacterium]|nr:acyltransferase [Alphaproteobacteria bacterium]